MAEIDAEIDKASRNALRRDLARCQAERDRLREGWKTAETELAELNEQYESLAEEAEAMEAYISKLQEEKRQLEIERDRYKEALEGQRDDWNCNSFDDSQTRLEKWAALMETALNKADTK